MAFNIADVIKQVQTKYDAANAANELRYKQIVGTSDPATGAFTGGLLENLGNTQRSDNAIRYTQARAGADQSLISRGLGNTTIRDSVQRGLLSDESRAAGAITESVANARAGVVERRNDIGPDVGTFANLLRDAASANTGPVSAVLGAAQHSGGAGGAGGGGSLGDSNPGGGSGGGGGGGSRGTGVQTYGAGGLGKIGATPLTQARDNPPYYPGTNTSWKFVDGKWSLVPRYRS